MPPLSRGSSLEHRRYARPAPSLLSLAMLPIFLVLHLAYHVAHALLSFLGLLRRCVRASKLAGGLLSSGSKSRVEARLAEYPAQGRRVPTHIAIVLAPPPPRTAQLLLRAALKSLGLQLPPLDLELQDEEARMRRVEDLVEQVREAARWCALVGCKRMSVYDPQGLVQSALKEQGEWVISWGQGIATADKVFAALKEGDDASGLVSGASTPTGAFHTPMLEDSLASFMDTHDKSDAREEDEEDTDSGFASGRSTPPTEITPSLGQPDASAISSASRLTLRIELITPTVVDEHSAEDAVAVRAAAKLASLQAPPSHAALPRSAPNEARLTLHLLGPDDARGAFVDTAKILIRRARAGDTRGVDVKAVDDVMAELNHPPEPDLLILHGGPRRVCALHGFPPWPLRLTEIYYAPRVSPRHPLSAYAFERALERFGGSEQRFGK